MATGEDRDASPTVARTLLAAALGVPEARLEALDARTVQRALDHLRLMISRYQLLLDRADIDELTGALRRGAGLSALQRDVDRTRRTPERRLTLAFLDVDGLKEVNDTAGHQAGDHLLRQAVAAIRERLRSYDLVVRYGGDEFVCALSNTRIEDARDTFAEVRGRVRARTGGHDVSVGFAELRDDDTVETLIRRADKDLYAHRSDPAAGATDTSASR